MLSRLSYAVDDRNTLSVLQNLYAACEDPKLQNQPIYMPFHCGSTYLQIECSFIWNE